MGQPLSAFLERGDEVRQWHLAPELEYRRLRVMSDNIVVEDVDIDGVDITVENVFTYLADNMRAGRKKDLIEEIADRYINEDVVCQDGIRLPLNISGIAPIGATCGIANFAASSRFALNMSRNAVDENPSLIRRWREDVGTIILKEIGRRVQACLDRCNIDYSWSGLWYDLETEEVAPIMEEKDWVRVYSSQAR